MYLCYNLGKEIICLLCFCRSILIFVINVVFSLSIISFILYRFLLPTPFLTLFQLCFLWALSVLFSIYYFDNWLFRFTQFKKYNLNRHMQRKHKEFYNLSLQSKKKCVKEVTINNFFIYRRFFTTRSSYVAMSVTKLIYLWFFDSQKIRY